LVAWQIGSLVDWQISSLVDWQLGWQLGSLAAWQLSSLAAWQPDSLAALQLCSWHIGRRADWQIGSLCNRTLCLQILCNVMSDIGCRREQRAPAINTTSARAHPHTPILPTSMCAASNINISCTCTFACSSMCMCMYTDLPAMYHVHQSYDVYMIYDMVINMICV
jgi:hypothetical protein